jgi:hypothetical protein
MAFIKHGDGKIVSVFNTDEDLTEDQKKAVKKISQQAATTPPDAVDSSDKKSGR